MTFILQKKHPTTVLTNNKKQAEFTSRLLIFNPVFLYEEGVPGITFFSVLLSEGESGDKYSSYLQWFY